MQSQLKARHLLFTLPAVVVALVVACSGGTQAPKSPAAPTETPAGSTAAPAGSGTLTVRITDSPFADASAVLITFSKVTAHTSDDAWVTLPFADGGDTRTCDLKKLEGAEDVLGTTALAAGHYTQLRLTVSSARIYFPPDMATSGQACAATFTVPPDPEAGKPVDVPSGIVKLIHPFDITGSVTTTILLDFDGDKSIRETGNGAYKMQPVIKVVSVQ